MLPKKEYGVPNSISLMILFITGFCKRSAIRSENLYLLADLSQLELGGFVTWIPSHDIRETFIKRYESSGIH